ncbi:MAG TPA: diguanylate cyclase [Candidatus Baltobacteraceae bacterium]|jgi:diguanylate cyclase (GGDEF)-like protein|nr:diguanylate cyclase [Candidatus Baltobacteraceae bacterium]
MSSDGVEVPGGGFLVVNAASRKPLYADATALSLLRLCEDEFNGNGVGEVLALIPDLADLTPRTFVWRTPWDDELFVRTEALISGTAGPSKATLVRLKRTEPARGTARQLVRLEELWTGLMREDMYDEKAIARLLQTGMAGLGFPCGMVGYLGRDGVAVAGAVYPPEMGSLPSGLQDALLALAPAESEPILNPDTEADCDFALSHPVLFAEGVRALAGMTFRVGEMSGTLAMWSFAPLRMPFVAVDRRYLEFLNDALKQILAWRFGDAQMRQLAYSDELTGLPNRAALFERIEEVLSAAQRYDLRFAILFIDLDGFKTVNDTLGHSAGDRVLAELSQRVRATLRRSEFIGRLGGDEFAVVLPQVASRDEIDRVLMRISDEMARPVHVEGNRFTLSASIGVAVYPGDGKTRHELLVRADSAMYAAKTAGRSRVHYTEPAYEFNAICGTLHPDQRDAGIPDSGYLLCYQPVLDLASQRVRWAEAFVRRVHPLYGLLAPDRILENIRADADRKALDRWVLREAATQARAWMLEGKSVRIGVHLAAFDPAAFAKMLDHEGRLIDFANVALELEAKQLQGDADAMRRFAASCRERGVTLNIVRFDDASASFERFADLPIDAVKLERSMIDGLFENAPARAILERTVRTAKSFGWRVVSQGVETPAQCEIVAAAGCDAIQGFGLAYPMTAYDFMNWLRTRDTELVVP